MSHTFGTALLFLCFSLVVWCYETSGHPLDSLFRTLPSVQKHSDLVPAIGSSGGGLTARELVESGHRHRTRQTFATFPPHHRWYSDRRPLVRPAGDTVSAFEALPAVALGGVSREDDFTGPGGPIDTVEMAALGPTSNEIGDNPLLLPLGFNSRPPVMVEPDDGSFLGAEDGRTPVQSIDLIREQLDRIKQQEDIEIKSNLLMKLLAELPPEGPLPIVYVEDAAGSQSESNNGMSKDNNDEDDDDDYNDGERAGRIVTQQFTSNGYKRTGRYYRPYPWKRQNSRSQTYVNGARYLCVPSRDDVFKLLMGLHDNRAGNPQQPVSFCNRRRPPKAILTKIRFFG
ncbi:uncharacterized protein LOC131208103 [Anopheles bellator]|uniref:uncharacterized protein LOC131208103 n=1 Tax=Anopheles bellator TaxID=139047 RepID=UPI002648DDC4|nr:uncharacterized protein LOC131208103 [Anopheles bellator]